MKAVQVILISALLLCLFPMPYGYFILVRYLATVVFTIMAYHHYKQQNNATTYLWVCLALLFQPFLKITLGREIWNVVDIVVAIILVIVLWKERKATDKASALKGVMQEINKNLFPGGTKQIEKETQLLQTSLHGRYSFEDVKNTLLYISSIFLLSTDKSQDGIVSRVLKRPQNSLDRSSIIVIYQFVAKKAMGKNKKANDSDLQYILNFINGNINNGCTENEIPNGYGEFGLTKTNPVPVKGILANEAYLSQLRTLKGDELRWNRLGSTHAPNIDSPIDIYRITTKDGIDMGHIYINPYQNHTSTKAPKGFIHTGTGYSQPPLPICYQQIYSKNLAIDDIRDKQGNLLTSVSMQQIIPLLIKYNDGKTNDLIEKAKNEYLVLIKQGYPDAYNNLAIIDDFRNGGNKTIFQKGVEAGSLNACFNLSIVEDNEEGFAWNKKAITWIKEPTSEIEIVLIINMAIRYQFGYGCTANLSKAKELYNKALYWNSNIAENNLGAIFMKEGNLEQAKRLFNRAIAEKSHYRHGIDVYEVISMAQQNLQLI